MEKNVKSFTSAEKLSAVSEKLSFFMLSMCLDIHRSYGREILFPGTFKNKIINK